MRVNDTATARTTDITDQVAVPTNLHLWGIDHHAANTDVRAAAYFDDERTRRFLQAFTAEKCGIAAVVLCTCNRTEIYLEVAGSCRSRSALQRSLTAAGVDSHLFLESPGWHLEGDEAARHLFRVTAGLESMALGEVQIRTQVKRAYQQAAADHRLGTLLMRVFQGAFRASKRVRTETKLSSGPVSVASIAVEEACRRLGDMSSHHGLLIGAGKTGSLTARHLLRRGIGKLTIINRSRERAEELAAETRGEGDVQVRVRSFTELQEALNEVDLVLTATGAPDPIITGDMITTAVRQRNGTPLRFFDLAVPRDIAPDVAALERVEVVGLDELSTIVAENLEARRREVPRAEQVIDEELLEFSAWARLRQINPTVMELRSFMEQVAAKELEWIRRKQPAETAEVVEKSLKVFIKKLLQRPVIQLKTANSEAERCQDLNCLQRLFELPQDNAPDRPAGGT